MASGPMTQASQTQLEHPQQPPSVPNGFDTKSEAVEIKIIPLNEIEPDFQRLLNGSDCLSQKGHDAGMRVLDIRKRVMDRVYGIKETEGRKKRHASEVMNCKARLEQESNTLNAIQKMAIEGLMEEAQAKSDLCTETVKQWTLELAVLYLTIGGKTEG